MINDDERKKRQAAYEIAKKNSESRGVPLTQETEAIMKKNISMVKLVTEVLYFLSVSTLATMNKFGILVGA